jgi:hypothetical protein
MPGKATYSAGTAYLTVVPSMLGIDEAFRRQIRDVAQSADKDVAAGMARGLADANKQAKASGSKSGRDFAGAYEAEAKKSLVAAYKSLPEPQPDVDLRKWDKALAGVRSEMKELSGQRIGIDIDQKTFDKAIDDFKKRLVDLRDSASGVNKDQGFFNADQAIGNLGNLQAFTQDVTKQASDAGDQAGGAFNERMARTLREGLSKLPPITLTADSTDAERKISDVQKRMLALQGARIGIDLDAGEAFTELVAINAELRHLDNTDVRVDIRTNAHEAAAGMGAFITQAENAGRSTEGIGTSANFSLSRLEYLIALGVSLGSAIVPAALAAAGAVGLIGTAAAAGIAGVGVFALGISGVSAGVKALDGYQKDQAKSANNVSQANRAMSSSTDGVRQAQAALANTRRTVAQGEVDAAQRVQDAERGLSDARRAAGRDQIDQARQVHDAQVAVTDAEKDAKDVRKDLNNVIRDAVRSMQELDVELVRNNQDQQEAVTAQMDALAKLNALKANPRATEIQLRQAKDAYDEQTTQLVELRQKHKELSEDKAKADKLGVEGDDKVIAARKKIADADERVGKAQDNLARQQDQQRESEYQGQQRIAAAERQVGDARRQQARQAQDGQFQLANAAAAVTAAQRSQQQAWEKTGLAGGDALSKLNQQMAELSPAAQHFAKFLFGLKDEVLQLRAAAAEPLLPQLETAIKLLLPYLPAVEKFVSKIADAMGGLAVKSVQALGNPVWQRFFGYIDKTAVPSLNMLYTVGQNVAQGLISLFLALTPFNGQVGSGLVDLSRDFALWAERLNKSAGYQEFLQYVRENGPQVVKFLGEIGLLLIDLVKAAAPLGSVVLRTLSALVDVINSIPLPVLTLLVTAIGAVALGMTVLGARMRVLKLREQLTDIFGPKMTGLVNTYALETGRATKETGAFGKASATAAGFAANAGSKVSGLVSSIGALPGRMVAAANAVGPLGRGIDSVRAAAFNTALAVNGPGGMAGAVQAATGKVTGLGAAGVAAVSGGLSKVKFAIADIAVAANGPGGLAAGASNAAGKVSGLAKSAGTAATAIGGKLMSGLGSAVAFLGGPWGVALAGASLAIGYFANKSAEQSAKVSSLKSVLADLSGTYRDLSLTGKQASTDADDAFRAIVKNNPDMQQAVIQLNALGIGFDQMVHAATSGDPSAVLSAIDGQIKSLNDQMRTPGNFFQIFDNEKRKDKIDELYTMRDAFEQNSKALGTQNTAVGLLNGTLQRNQVLEAAKLLGTTTGTAAQQALIGTYDQNAAQIDVLNGLVAAFTGNEGNAATQADAMRAAIDLQTGSVIKANEANETFAAKLIGLTDQVNSAKAAHDRNSTSLNLNSTTALRNRDALEDVATSIRDMYLQDIAAGKPIKDVTAAHDGRIAALKAEALRLGLARGETDKLIKTYGGVPKNVQTIYQTKDFATVFNQLKQLKFIQDALAKGMSVEKAKASWNAQEWWAKGFQGPVAIPAKAEGGPIEGPGTKTSDSVLMWGSKGEFMQPAASVDYYGEGLMEGLRSRRIPKELLAGYATGGPIKTKGGLPAYAKGGGVTNVPMPIRLADTKVMTLQQVIDSVPRSEGDFTGLSADASVRKMQEWALAQKGKRYLWSAVGPNRYDCSGLVGNLWGMATGHSLYHRYMSTGDMGPGKHGMVSGPGKNMTIYLGPGHTAANVGGLHAEAYGGNGVPLAIGHVGTPLSYYTQKLHIPGFAEGGPVDPSTLVSKRDRMLSFLRFGWPEPPTEGTFADLIGTAGGNQFDAGGMLPPGYSTVVNATGRPEPVLTDQQWKEISGLARGDAGPGSSGSTYNFEFRDTTLDAGKLRALQDQEAVLHRQGRAR